jgi:hypothetical protein
MARSEADTEVLERVKMREVAGVFRSRDVLDAAVAGLLSSGFDRADIDIVAGTEARRKLGGAKVAVEELPEVPAIPRQPLLAREDLVLVSSLVLAILIFAGTAAAAWLVVASGGELRWAAAAAIVGAIAAAVIGAQITRAFNRKHVRELEAQLISSELVLLVRVRSPDEEAKAGEILLGHGAQAVRPHEIAIDKRLQDLPVARQRTSRPPVDRLRPSAHSLTGTYKSKSKRRCERSQCSVCGFFNFGSMILKVRASATLIPPAISASRASVSSL